MASRISLRVLAALGLVWLVMRFVGLQVSPPGFWMDEAWPATHSMCLAETGHDADGVRWPLYSTAGGGSQHALTLLGFNVAWLHVFGTSRAAFRAVAGFWVIITCVALFDLSRSLMAMIPSPPQDEREAAARRSMPWWVLLSALLSPWGFHFSRIAWDAPLAAGLLIVSLASLARARRLGRASIPWSVACGIFGALAMITYNPLRVTTPLVLLGATVVLGLTLPDLRARYAFLKRATLAAGCQLAVMGPTLIKLLNGEINARINALVIFNDQWVTAHRDHVPRALFILGSLLDNLALYLRPSYLLFWGDPNARHSPHIIGQLSPLDDLALALVAITVIAHGYRSLRSPETPPMPHHALHATGRWLAVIAASAVVAGALGALPAALTWERQPHALRSIGAWPFIALFSGAVIAGAWSLRRSLAPVIATVAVVYSAWFFPSYFHAYDNADPLLFFRSAADAVEAGPAPESPRVAIEQVARSLNLPDQVLRYYLMHDGHLSCDEAVDTLRKLRRAPRQR